MVTRSANAASAAKHHFKGDLVFLLFCLFASLSLAQSTPADSVNISSEGRPVDAENTGAAVEIDGRPILVVYSDLAGFSAEERAETIQQRIIAIAESRNISTDSIHSKERVTWTEILAGNNRILAITSTDAVAAGRQRGDMAAEYVELIRQAVRDYRKDHSTRRVIVGTARALIATVALGLLLYLLFSLRGHLRSLLDSTLARGGPGSSIEIGGATIRQYLGHPLLILSRIAFWLIVLSLLQVYGTLMLRFFPATRYTSYQITNWTLSQISHLGKAAIDYLPDLMLLALIVLGAYCLISFSTYIFGEIRAEKLAIRGFYPDWAQPTAKLLRVLILIAAGIVAFPYLPGSQSPAFKGISVFLGLLLSLGSTSAMGHAVAGTILTYMRAFQIGDVVKIGSEMGEVIEKTLLVTRMRTQKNEVITIPNGTVLGGVVLNYSAEGRKRGVIFHTVVTIGYSAPWRKVHELLILAASETEDILPDPPPFVLQTGLNEFYVAYELNAYTAKPMNMLDIYSRLHQNIQDKFNEAGVEINSPHYTSLRDGNASTIPHNYLPENYKCPAFEVEQRNGTAMSQPPVEKCSAQAHN